MIAVFNKAKGALKSVPEITTINTANKIATGYLGQKLKRIKHGQGRARMRKLKIVLIIMFI